MNIFENALTMVKFKDYNTGPFWIEKNAVRCTAKFGQITLFKIANFFIFLFLFLHRVVLNPIGSKYS